MDKKDEQGRGKKRIKEIRARIGRGLGKAAILMSTAAMLNGCASLRKVSSDNEGHSGLKEKMEQAAEQQRVGQAKADIKEAMINNKQLYQAFCSQRSKEMSREMLSFCADLQNQIKKNGRSVLQKRYGKNGEVPIGRHCLRSIVESMTECAKRTGIEELRNGFCKPLRQINPNGCYGVLNMYQGDSDLKQSRTIQSEIEGEAQKHPNDIFLVMHKSSQNNTNSGMHAIAVVGVEGELHAISFNNERIVPYKEYCAGRPEVQEGYVINLSQKVAQGDDLQGQYAKFVDQTVEKAISQNQEHKIPLKIENDKKMLSLIEELGRAKLSETMAEQRNDTLENMMALSALDGNKGVLRYTLNSENPRTSEEVSNELVKVAKEYTPGQTKHTDRLASAGSSRMQSYGRG